MSPAHLHLMLNHVPVIGTLFVILLLALAVLRRSPELTKVSLGAFVLLAVIGVVVYLTGEPAEELVEDLPGVSKPILENHEEAALLATVLLVGVGAVALGGLVAFRRRAAGIPRGFAMALLLISLLPAGAMAYAANLGGQIRHSEIRPGAVASTEPGSSGEQGEDSRAGAEHSNR